MVILGLPRGGGKTTHILNLLRVDKDAIVVVTDHAEAQHLQNLLIESVDYSKGDLPQVYIVDELCVRSLRGRKPSAVYVDNLDHVLQRLIGHPVTLATMTAGD